MSDDIDDEIDEAPEPDSTLTLLFDPPIKVRQATYDTMQLSEPTGKQVRQAEGKLRNGINVETLRMHQFILISLVTGWPEDALEQLPITKIDEAGRFLSRFTKIGPPTGKR